jgi:hypothetical protein
MEVVSKKYILTPEVLSKTWGIGLPVAKRTLLETTQRMVQSSPFPNKERRRPTGERPLRHCRLHHGIYHDTLKSQVISLRGNKFSEVYAIDFGWSRNFQMKKEADVHEILDIFITK